MTVPDSRVKTLFVSQYFPPEPSQVPISIVRSLRAKGHDVQVLTGIPNYPQGRVIDGYVAWKPRKELVDRFRVLRAPLFPSHSSSRIGRLANYVSWAVSSALIGAPLFRAADVTLVYSSPGTAAFAPALWSRITHTPYVLLIEDLWPDTVTTFLGTSKRSALIGRALTIYVSWTYRRAAHVVVISPGMKRVLVERGVPDSKISLVYNWVDRSGNTPSRSGIARESLGIPANAFVATYAGNLGRAQGIGAILDAARILCDQDDVLFLIAGDGIERKDLQSKATAQGLQNVRFVGRLPAEAMPTLYEASDIQLVSLVDDRLFEITMPSKIQSILVAGEPLIAMARGDVADVVERSGAGLTVPPSDPSALAEAVLKAWGMGDARRRAMGASGRSFYDQHMSEARGSARLDEVIRAATSTPRRRSRK